MSAAPTPFRLDDERRVARALGAGRFMSIADVAEATGLDQPTVFAVLRDFTKRGLVVAQSTGSPGCHGRRDGPEFFYSKTDAMLEALRADRKA